MTTTVWPAAWRCSATPSQSRALDARPWTSTKGAAARSPTRTSTYSSIPGATTMRRSITLACDDPFGSVMAPILASLAAGRGATVARGANPALAPDRIGVTTWSHEGGAHGGWIDRRLGRGAHLDGGRSLSRDGALLSGHARAHAAFVETGFHQLRLERDSPERGRARSGPWGEPRGAPDHAQPDRRRHSRGARAPDPCRRGLQPRARTRRLGRMGRH